jgi:hypothetical protein
LLCCAKKNLATLVYISTQNRVEISWNKFSFFPTLPTFKISMLYSFIWSSFRHDLIIKPEYLELSLWNDNDFDSTAFAYLSLLKRGIISHLETRARVTRWVCEKFAQNVAQAIIVKINALT